MLKIVWNRILQSLMFSEDKASGTPEAAQAVMLAIKQASISGYSNGTQILLPTPLGERLFEVSMAKKEPVVGEPPRFIALSRDITERKREQLEIERLINGDSDSLEQVLKHADHAMYSAKKRDSSQYQFYLE